MSPQEIIRKKRDGQELAASEIEEFISGVCSGQWADYQISALIMAIFLRGLNETETEHLVRAMINSGERLDFTGSGFIVGDKHSTGGVGDKTSLIIAPVAAACGLKVPMISGRGLGHTGGTLDKLESIKGYRVNLTKEEIYRIIEKCGFALAGQTDRLVPADRKMYAIRDATATIEYIPLIVASIMSKKIAEGLNALIIDVKAGSGAFMQQLCDAENLAAELVKTGEKFKIKSRALISDMNRPLGKFIGNSVEVYEAVKILKGEKDRLTERTRELSLALTAHLIEIVGLAENHHAAMEICVNALDSGKAFELFLENVKLQGGEPQCVEKPETLLPENSLVIENETPGFITEINARKIGEAVCRMGGGRVKAEDRIDHSIGIELIADINDRVEKGDPLCRIFYSNRRPNEKDTEDIRNAFIIEEKAAESTDSLIMKVIS